MNMNEIVDRRLEGDTALRQVQLTTLYLLDVLDAICRENGIRYFLAFGTLLGALRHKGFIPWDDDLDVGMLEEDYKKFINIAPKLLPKNILLQTQSAVPGVFEAFAKLRDLSSLALETHSSMSRPSGIYIDIFPFVKSPAVQGKVAHLIIRGLSVCWRRSRLHRVADHYSAFGLLRSFVCCIGWSLLRCCLKVVWCLLRLLSRSKLYRVIPEVGGHSPEVAFTKDEILPAREVEFEGKLYFAPNKSEDVLKKYYGNWQELPPESERKGHHTSIFTPIATMPFWWLIPHKSFPEKEAEQMKETLVPRYLVKL